MKIGAAVLSLALFTSGCFDDPAAVTSSALDVGYYECQIQPLFDRSCAFTGCHGNPGRALFTYSASKRRIVDVELIGEALTDKELCWNFYRASSFATIDPLDSQLITKPETLASEASQYHEGNYLFGAEDPEAKCLRAWMGGAQQATGTSTPSEACHLPWRVAFDGTPTRCAPRAVDCAAAIDGPDLPEVPR